MKKKQFEFAAKTLLALFISSIALFAFQPEKKIKVELPVPVWEKHLYKQSVIRQIVDASDMPHQQAEFVKKSIDSLFMDAMPQLQAQVDTTKKK